MRWSEESARLGLPPKRKAAAYVKERRWTGELENLLKIRTLCAS